jgi:septal ring factor EnvC (AmiA/AmiB activator)
MVTFNCLIICYASILTARSTCCRQAFFSSSAEPELQSPIAISRALASARIEVANLRFKVGEHDAIVHSRDRAIEQLESRLSELEQEVNNAVEEARKAEEKLSETERLRTFDQKEVELLRQQLVRFQVSTAFFPLLTFLSRFTKGFICVGRGSAHDEQL